MPSSKYLIEEQDRILVLGTVFTEMKQLYDNPLEKEPDFRVARVTPCSP
jgi:hypothetical protein